MPHKFGLSDARLALHHHHRRRTAAPASQQLPAKGKFSLPAQKVLRAMKHHTTTVADERLLRGVNGDEQVRVIR